jgi:hypothetical protein
MLKKQLIEITFHSKRSYLLISTSAPFTDDTCLGKSWFWLMCELFLLQLQWSSVWVHLSLPPTWYTCSQHFWLNCTRICGPSNLVILGAKWSGLGSELGGLAMSLSLQNHQIWHPMTLSLSQKWCGTWVYSAHGQSKRQITAAVDSSNFRDEPESVIGYISVMKDEMGRACSMKWRGGMHVRYWWESQTERDH